MTSVLIIADDLTGANANCALMKTIGLRAASITASKLDNLPQKMDAVAFTTDSRAMSKDHAYKRVFDKVNKYKNDSIELYSKRIDSTLRGNLGSELKAYQDALDNKKLAVCVPSFPDSKRIVINDFMYVDGIPLMNTDAGKDSKISAISNKVTENFKKDYEGEVVHISIEEIEKGIDHIRDIIIENKDKDLLIFDSITNDQISLIAKASLDSGIDFMSVDPGPFTKELTKLLYKSQSISTKAIAVIGSVTNVTMKQMAELKKRFDYYQVDVDPLKLINIDQAIVEIENSVNESCKNLDKYDLIIITTTPESIEDRLNLKEISDQFNISIDDLSLMISRGLAKIAKEVVIKESSISGIFSSGGDVTVAVIEELLSDGIEIREEIQPLVAYGRVINGLKPDLKLVSKGGMVGNDIVMAECIQRILNEGE
ncbi:MULTISPECIES: four-carbon acid sugar kinase family protein [Anaerococcus]|uniref:Uncharacterized protein conserved in bacteria n=1 Tax=Anaerococcus octavius TaxID=54007 RepID=A0A2I1MBC6_9FIRM|nr:MULTISPECIES: four-carbon acid sugar kinase family protein [Anaerococcus]MBS6105360.1 four-carbon acid sugar kinase family protein [Anaerococcus sp.]PKZ17417.1 hypothetical protein CYJ34_01540 [Anaerococcus octavius]SUU93086.1 Uncharacterized protein conserved in bacteria [Anaerococcus octavius]